MPFQGHRGHIKAENNLFISQTSYKNSDCVNKHVSDGESLFFLPKEECS